MPSRRFSVFLLSLLTLIGTSAAHNRQLQQAGTANAPALSQAAQAPSLYYPENSPSDPTFLGYNVAGYNPYGSVSNIVTEWNLAGAEVSRITGYDAPRLLSLMHLALYLSLETAAGRNFTTGGQEASAAFAAHFVLAQLAPQDLNDYDDILATQLQGVTLADAQAGASLGEGLATALLQNRTNDGSQRFIQVPIALPSGPPGAYAYAPNQTFPRNMNKANATTFLVPVQSMATAINASQQTAYAVGSQQYIADLIYARDNGENTSPKDANLTRIARQWYDEASGTGGISVHWNQIALATLPEDISLADTAELFAMLNVALADGRVTYFTVKYRDLTWRPINALRAGYPPQVPAVPDWTPYLPTVPEPEFPSGHSTLSATAAAVLQGYYGTDHVDFSIGGEGPLPNGVDPVAPVNFTSFSSVVGEVSLARCIQGVHFRRATQIGEQIGAQVGAYVFNNFQSLVSAYSTLSTALQAPPPPVSQPIYNPAIPAIVPGTYAVSPTSAPSTATG